MEEGLFLVGLLINFFVEQHWNKFSLKKIPKICSSCSEEFLNTLVIGVNCMNADLFVGVNLVFI